MAVKMDVEKLIEYVRQHVYLYDITDKDYKNVNVIKNTWNAIGNKLGVSGDAAKKAWQSKRDYYRRLVNKKRNVKSGQAAGDSLDNWEWYPFLSFLNKYMAPASTTTNMDFAEEIETSIENSDTNVEDALDDRSIDIDRSLSMQSVTGNRSNSAASVTSTECDEVSMAPTIAYGYENVCEKPTPLLVGKKRKMHKDSSSSKSDKVGEAIITYLDERKKASLQTKQAVQQITQENKELTRDEDELFLSSLKTHLKSLNKKQKIEAKMEMLNILYRKQFDVETYTPATEYSRFARNTNARKCTFQPCIPAEQGTFQTSTVAAPPVSLDVGSQAVNTSVMQSQYSDSFSSMLNTDVPTTECSTAGPQDQHIIQHDVALNLSVPTVDWCHTQSSSLLELK